MTNGSFSLTIKLQDQFFLIGVQVFDGNYKQSFIAFLHFSGREANSKDFITVRIDSSCMGRDREESRVNFSCFKTDYLAIVVHFNSADVLD